MDSIKNYGLFLERKAYTKINESLVSEAAAPDMQNDAGLKKVMSGETSPTYQPQWDQLITHMEANLKKDGTYTANIAHDNKKPMINIEYKVAGGKIDGSSIKPAAVSASSTVAGSAIDINKIAEYDPKGKMYEFVAALITVSIQKFGKAWTPDHIKWVTAQINKVKALGGFYTGIEKPAGSTFLQGDGNIADSWIKLTGGDLPNQVTTITSKYKKAGSVDSDADIKMIMDAVDIKLNETITSFADSAAMHGLYMLISPKVSAGQLAKMWKDSGKSGGFLTGIAGEIDEIKGLTPKWSEKFVVWTVGVRGLTYWDGFYKAYGFDKDSYTASLAAIKAALV